MDDIFRIEDIVYVYLYIVYKESSISHHPNVLLCGVRLTDEMLGRPSAKGGVHRRNPRDFYPLHFFHERSVADRNPVGSDNGRRLAACRMQYFRV